MKQEHTPTPWEIIQNGNGHWAIVAGEDRLGDYIATVEGEADDVDSSRLLMAINAANAALIVRAVNAHDDLVKLAELIISPPDDFACDVRHADELAQSRRRKIEKMARAALAKARG